MSLDVSLLSVSSQFYFILNISLLLCFILITLMEIKGNSLPHLDLRLHQKVVSAFDKNSTHGEPLASSTNFE